MKPITATDFLGPVRAEATRAIAERLFADFGLAHKLDPYEPYQHRTASLDVACLHLDDVTAIPFVSGVPGVEDYQHRARVRGRDGDIFAAVTPQHPGYSDYCRDQLLLGDPTFVLAAPITGPMNVALASAHGTALDEIATFAKDAGGLAIHPYMGIQEVWALAAAVAERSGVKITVIAPPPPTLWLANDKARLDACARALLDDSWVVETHESSDPAELEELLSGLAARHKKVAIKRTRCASAMGNAVFTSERLLTHSPGERERKIGDFLIKTEWDGCESVLAVAWEETDVSPSTQLWIPPMGQGDPYVEGVYEQLLEGEEKAFLGSRISTLPESVNEKLIEGSLVLGLAFQRFGYVGRCSFDFIVVGDLQGDFQVRFTECNGRWGGTSTPMHLVDRLVGSPRPHYWAQDFMHPDLVGVPLDEILRRVGDHAFDARTGKGRFIFYNVGPLTAHGKLDVISLGESADDAAWGVSDLLPELLGLDPADSH